MKYSKPTSKKADLFDRNQANKKVGTIDVYTEQGVSTIVIAINGQKPLQQMMAEKAVDSTIDSFVKERNLSIVWERPKKKYAYLFDNGQIEKEAIGTIGIEIERGVATLTVEISGKKPVTQKMSEKSVTPTIEKFAKKYNLSVVWDDSTKEIRKVGKLNSSFKSKIESLRKALFQKNQK